MAHHNNGGYYVHGTHLGGYAMTVRTVPAYPSEKPVIISSSGRFHADIRRPSNQRLIDCDDGDGGDGGNWTYSITARRMISGLVLK